MATISKEKFLTSASNQDIYLLTCWKPSLPMLLENSETEENCLWVCPALLPDRRVRVHF